MDIYFFNPINQIRMRLKNADHDRVATDEWAKLDLQWFYSCLIFVKHPLLNNSQMEDSISFMG